MRLNEIYRSPRNSRSPFTAQFTIEHIEVFDDEGIVPFDVEVDYDYEPADHSDHPYGDTTAREHHPSSIAINSITSITPIRQLDDDDKVIKEWPKGTDVMSLPGWSKEDLEWFEEQATNEAEK